LKPVEVKEVVLVTDAAPLLQTDNANIVLTFSSRQIDLLPIPGGDITTMAFTMPGVVVSTGAGYGNFSSHGLPPIANLFTTNSFFSNATGTPRARALSNRYAALMGGRIVRDKLFFLVDTEGLRYTLPTRGVVSIPSTALQSYVLRTVSAAQRSFYQQAFNLYN